MNTFTLPWRHLRAINLAASRDETRYVLQGVLLEFRQKGYVTMVATDGRFLVASRVVCEHDMAKDAKVIVPSVLIKAIKPQKIDDLEVVIDGDPNNRKISLTRPQAIHISMPEIDGNYPTWRAAIKPQGELRQGMKEIVDLRILNKVYEIKKLLTADSRLDSSQPIDIYSHKDESLRQLYAMLDDSTVAVAMPMRGDGKKFAFPDWMKEIEG